MNMPPCYHGCPHCRANTPHRPLPGRPAQLKCMVCGRRVADPIHGDDPLPPNECRVCGIVDCQYHSPRPLARC